MKAAPRLAAGLVDTGMLDDDAMSRAVDDIARMATLARQLGAERVEAVATSAVRDASNGDEFVLEDLDSCNGTHVDGVPILSCVLHDGDAIQIGQHLFYFERVLEPAAPARGGQS